MYILYTDTTNNAIGLSNILYIF